MVRGLQDGDRIVQASIDDSRDEGVNSGKRKELRLLRRVVGQFRPYRGKVGLVGVLILVTAGLGVANPLLVKVVFDQALFVPDGPNLGRLGLLVGLMIAITIVARGLSVWRAYLTTAVRLDDVWSKTPGCGCLRSARLMSVSTLPYCGEDNGHPQSHAHTRTC